MELLDKIMNILLSIEGASATLAIVAEFVFRKVIKSKKPLSLFYAAEKLLVKLAAVMKKLGDLLDKILPQKLQD